MKAWMLLADSIRLTGDGTFGALRAGINVFSAQEFPADFRGSVLVRFYGLTEAERKETHSFRLEFEAPDGSTELNHVNGAVAIPDPNGQSLLVVDVKVSMEAQGLHFFRVYVDDKLLDEWTLFARERGKKDEQSDS